MGVIHEILYPFEKIGNSFYIKPDPYFGSLSGATDCIPFYQFNGKLVVVSNASTMSSLWPYIWNTVCSKVGAYGVSAGTVFSIVSEVDQLINAGWYKQQYTQNVKLAYADSLKALQWKLDCHLPYCEIATWLTTIDTASQFYDKTQQQNLMNVFLASTIVYNNNRLQSGAHVQTILDTHLIDEDNFKGTEDRGFVIGGLMIRVPNVEAYWMGEKIKISGCGDTEFTITNRYGITKDRKNVDCYLEVRDKRYFCKGQLDQSTRTQYNNEGCSLAGLYGPGWLYLDKPYSKYNSLIRANQSQVSLKNTQIIPMPSTLIPYQYKITTPPATTTPPTTTTPPATNTMLTNLLTIPSNWLKTLNVSSFGSLAGQLLLIGIGITFLYEAFNDQESEKKQIENLTSDDPLIKNEEL